MGNYILKPLIFDTPGAADRIIADIRNLFKEFGYVSVADVYDLAGVNTKYIDNQYGWATQEQINELHFEIFDDSYMFKYPTPLDIRDRTGTHEKTIEEVNHPDHYQSETGLEALDVIEAFTFDLKGVEAFDTGNVLKYMCRWKKKNGLKDLKKAKWYLEHLINHVEKLKKEND